jgi:hypothetical protein
MLYQRIGANNQICISDVCWFLSLMRELLPPPKSSAHAVRLQLRIEPMLPADAAALAADCDFDGLTVFAAGVMRPGMGLEDLAQLAFEGLRGDQAL